MKTLIKNVLNNFDQDNIVDPQFRWEYLKYEIRKFSIHFSKDIARNKKIERMYLENKLKTLETRPDFINDPKYTETNEKLDKIYQEKINGFSIRSKCNWYEHGEKSSKIFLSLEKSHAVQNQIRNILLGNTEVDDQKYINNELYSYYKNLFNERQHLSEHDINNFLNTVSNFPQLSTEQSLECEKNISEKELLEALKSMPNDKSPGNDGLTKEFFETFWSEIKKTFLSCVIHSFDKGELCTSQRQAIIKLIEKKDKDKRLIQNWRPISLLNVDTKIISKALSKRLKNVLLSLISDNQSAYVDERFISQGGRLVADVLQTTDVLKLSGMLVTIDIQKAFHSVNHKFLTLALKRYGFGKMFIKWIKTLLNNQESCTINGGFTTKYFKLDRGTRQVIQYQPVCLFLFLK